MALDAVVFDMDGTLFDTERLWTEAHGPACAELGVEYKEGLAEAIRGTSGDSMLRALHAVFGEDFDAPRYVRALCDAVESLFEQGITKMPGLDDLLACLRERGIPTAVASGSTREQIDHHLRVTGLDEQFRVRISGFDVAHAKPAPDSFLEAARQLGATPARTMVVEDSPSGIRAAHAGGFVAVMVPNMEEPDEQTRSLCAAVCDSLLDVVPLVERIDDGGEPGGASRAL